MGINPFFRPIYAVSISNNLSFSTSAASSWISQKQWQKNVEKYPKTGEMTV